MFDVSHPGLSVSRSLSGLGNALHHTWRFILEGLLHYITLSVRKTRVCASVRASFVDVV